MVVTFLPTAVMGPRLRGDDSGGCGNGGASRYEGGGQRFAFAHPTVRVYSPPSFRRRPVRTTKIGGRLSSARADAWPAELRLRHQRRVARSPAPTLSRCH